MNDMSIIAVASTAISLLAVLAIRFLVDLKIAHSFVRYFYWVPSRWLFRDNPVSIAGKWDHYWDVTGSGFYENNLHRHGVVTVRQFGCYCHAELYTKKEKYTAFGVVKSGYFIGEWYDSHDKSGYFGAFQLEIQNHRELVGIWLGHSKSERKIRSDNWFWSRLPE